MTLAPLTASLGAPGEDRYAAVSPDDFFGTLLEGDDAATDGLDVLLRVPEVASIVVPDLYSPAPVPGHRSGGRSADLRGRHLRRVRASAGHPPR